MTICSNFSPIIVSDSPSRHNSIVLASKWLLYVTFWSSILISLWRPIRCTDLWWHLASGRYILQHHQIPKVDVFSLTCRGRPWINIEWLYQIVLYPCYQLGGLAGVTTFKVFIIALALTFLMLRLRRSGLHDIVLFTGAMIVFATCASGWSERADLISVALVSALMYTLEGVRKKRMAPTQLWWWVLIFLAWSNAHAGFLIGIGISGLYALEFIRARRWSMAQASVWVISLLMVTLANPSGISSWKMIAVSLSNRYPDIVEYQPPPWSHMYLFWMTGALFVLLWAGAVERRIRMPWIAYVLSLIFGFEAVRHVRYVPFFMFSAFPFAVETVDFGSLRERGRLLSTLFLRFALCGVFFAMAQQQWGHATFGIARGLFPVDLCEFIAAHDLKGRFLNEYDFGSYWIWRFNGDPAVFIDGRLSIVEGYDLLKKEMDQARLGSPLDWQHFLDRYAITAVAAQQPAPELRRLALYSYFPKSRWALVYQDGLTLLFLRRSSYPDNGLLKEPDCRDQNGYV
jgi:hypothetical protein